jgi:hypothetical protein
MIKQILLSFILCILLISFVSSAECDDSNEININDIPCEAITPSLLCSDNASIVYLNNASINYSVVINLKIPATNTYNFSFYYTSLGKYLITLCDNSSATLNVFNVLNVKQQCLYKKLGYWNPDLVWSRQENCI